MTDNDEPVHPAGPAETVREAYEQAPVVLGALGLPPGYRFEAANAAYRAFMGGRDVVGRKMPELFPETLTQQIFELFDRVRESGEVQAVRVWRFQFDQNDSGQLIDVHLDMVLGPLHGPDGEITGVTLYANDVSAQVRERQEAQAKAAEAERRYQAARDVVLEVQRELLSASLPVLPDAMLAARYLVASRDQAAGGDWFDAVPLADGSVALVVGDIVGHGVAASAAMSQLRSVLNAVLTRTGDLEQALDWANDVASRSTSMRAATVCVAVLDPASGRLRYTTCGHPPPLAATVAGATRFLPPSGGGPLGTGSQPVIAEATLAPDEVLLLYTDGLIERPGQSTQDAMRELATVIGDAVANRLLPLGAPESAPERACEQGLELITRRGYDDDVTVLAAQRRSAPIAPLAVDLAAAPGRLAELRDTVRAWLWPIGPAGGDEHAIDLAVSELMANAIEHAYPRFRPGPVRLRADLETGGVLRLEVADDGVWAEPGDPPATSGRGLWLAGARLDDLRVSHPSGPGEHGTTVTIRHRLTRPAVVAADTPRIPARRPATEFAARLEEGPPRVLRVSGPLDIATADEFADQLDVAGRGGVFPLEVDLSEVELLASAAVRVLFQARDRNAAHGHPLTLRAVPGSNAADVLDLVGLPWQPAGAGR
ncbi:SpoIIE family protein phosphatase [Paractinoplanes lichenicola]|uniref:SpoIIE family protein phosphatase n=1 Tax=Paractinoplanes lichenicola TaxID=2802976 RepID=A0ABS1VW51_9ACTN|nr:SpoIIE family protein phosphatase [Actinoplanes lichenicola]MBL7258716.1 SpoIIE family protein phosphatase [Actinoplanes lichenicola]